MLALSSRPRRGWGESDQRLGSVDAASLLQRALTLSSAEVRQSRTAGPGGALLFVVDHGDKKR